MDQLWSETLSPPITTTELDVDCSRVFAGLYMQKAVLPSHPFMINYQPALSQFKVLI